MSIQIFDLLNLGNGATFGGFDEGATRVTQSLCFRSFSSRKFNTAGLGEFFRGTMDFSQVHLHGCKDFAILFIFLWLEEIF